MRSILSKFVFLMIATLLCLSIFLGSFSVYVVNKISKKDSEKLMKEACTEQVLSLNCELGSLEYSVLSIEDYIKLHLQNYDELLKPGYAEAFSDDVEKFAVNLAERTNGAISVYMRYNPRITGNGTGGFFQTKLTGTEGFIPHEPTNIFQYSVTDMEHVGWYYIPAKKRQAVWLDPYYNRNLNLLIISFVVPVYVENELVGVVGMDIDFTVFIDKAQKLSIYETGWVDLVSLSTEKIYYRNKESLIAPVFYTIISDEKYKDILPPECPPYLLEYVDLKLDGKVCCTYTALNNSMRLIVSVPKSEINAQRNVLAGYIFVLSIIILTLGIFFTYSVSKRIIKPLHNLTVAAEHFGKGEWDYEIECNTDDEIKTLTTTINKMACATQKYIEQINNMAYQDALTKVKNKASYLQYIDKIVTDNIRDYAVVIIDSNSLKETNDSFGHEAGDKLILRCSSITCKVFDHSPVFRIGGDEFCVILTGSDFENRVQLFDNLREEFKYKYKMEEINTFVSAACGMASSPIDGTDFNLVFKMADERMYMNKVEMKGSVR